MNIRRLEFKDLAALLRLYRFLHPDDPVIDSESMDTSSLWQSILDDPRYIYLGIEDDMRLVSTCTLAIIPNLTRGLRSYCLIENVVTDPEYRGKGYGRVVLKEALRISWEAGCYKAILETGRPDERTLRFYESAGFRQGIKTAFIAYRKNG